MGEPRRLGDPESARIVEVFSSLQGEGVRLGERQIFVRFGGCNLHCDYCDEPETIPIPSGKLWSIRRIEETIARLARQKRHGSISWTGGEPLLHVTALLELMPWAKKHGLRNYLETNGVLPRALKQVAQYCDVISMDVKLPSATGRACWSSHREFLKVASDKTFVKVVLTSDSTAFEWQQVIELLREAGGNIPLIVQPATAVTNSRDVRRRVEPIAPRRAIAYMNEARAVLKDVRLSPQWHPLWRLP